MIANTKRPIGIIATFAALALVLAVTLSGTAAAAPLEEQSPLGVQAEEQAAQTDAGYAGRRCRRTGRRAGGSGRSRDLFASRAEGRSGVSRSGQKDRRHPRAARAENRQESRTEGAAAALEAPQSVPAAEACRADRAAQASRGSQKSVAREIRRSTGLSVGVACPAAERRAQASRGSAGAAAGLAPDSSARRPGSSSTGTPSRSAF